jgi:fido (protein-threonine AMPylation protein)
MRDEKILQLWQSRCAIDIVFESSTNKRTLEAHRLVLAMQSSKLKELISSDLFFQPENGNGRISRMVGDLLAIYLGQPRFSWGSQSLIDANVTRAKYVAALRAADAHDLAPLISFARS